MELRDMYDFCIYICLALLIFSLAVSFIGVLNIYPTEYGSGVDVGTGTGLLEQLTGFSFPIIVGTTTIVGAAAGITLSWMFQSTAPLAISLFVAVFWTSYLNMLGIFGDFITPEIKVLFTVPILFVFSAAIIGMLKVG